MFLEKLEVFLLLFGVDVGELVATDTNPAEEGSLIVLRRSHDYRVNKKIGKVLEIVDLYTDS